MPASFFLTHIGKRQLTHDVYELRYSFVQPLDIQPGQFLLCDTSGDGKLKRSYSVSRIEGNCIYFIVKRLENGSGGSKAICDQEIGREMEVWGPMGTFILQNTLNPKIFIGTGTGFAPLYYMMRAQRSEQKTQNRKHSGMFFLFGVRALQDVFYLEELQQWQKEGNFDYQIYCSREMGKLPEKHVQGRVTDFLQGRGELSNLSSNNDEGRMVFEQGTEFYICGNPAMVTDVRGLLKNAGIADELVFFEQY